jgi:hypothetical protein
VDLPGAPQRKLFRETPGGYLYPAPLPSEAKQKDAALEHHRLVGRLMGKALIDSRLVDLPLHPLFWRLVKSTGEVPMCFSVDDLRDVDPEMYENLTKLEKMSAEDLEAIEVDFCLPGHDEILLCSGGDNKTVTHENLQEYMELVARFSLFDSIREVAIEFRKVFLQLHCLESIAMWSDDELSNLVVGVSSCKDEFWTMEHLSKYIEPKHGYTHETPAFVYLLTAMTRFTGKQRKNFLSFVTGAHSLPANGFQGLKPQLSVVKKDEKNPDDWMPSVMTCANYLKLPQYSSLEALEKKLFQAINGDGLHSFMLS